jgi:hypothetical protein
MSIVVKRIRPRLSLRVELCCPAALLGDPATSQQAKGPQALRPRLTTGFPFSQRTRLRMLARININTR